MKGYLLNLKAARVLFFALFVAMLILLSLTMAPAQVTTTFAQFLENNGTQDFVFTNNTTNAAFNAVSGGSSVSFRYQNISGLDPALQGFQNARLTITTTTTESGANNGGDLSQPLNQTVTVAIIRDQPFPAGTSRRNLLTAVFSPAGNTPEINGSGNSATVSATTPDHNVTFTSDFVSFAATTARNLSFSFSSVTPTLSLGAGGFLNSFTAAGTGTFASNPTPVVSIPTASTVEIGGRVLTNDGQGLRNAQVILTDSDGTIHQTQTGTFGNYRFSGIIAGQTVVVSVNSKRFTFAPRVVSVNDNVFDLDLTAED